MATAAPDIAPKGFRQFKLDRSAVANVLLQLGQRLTVHHDADTAGLFSGADQGLQDVKAAELDGGHRRTQPPAQQAGIGSGTDESVHLPALQALGLAVHSVEPMPLEDIFVTTVRGGNNA